MFGLFALKVEEAQVECLITEMEKPTLQRNVLNAPFLLSLLETFLVNIHNNFKGYFVNAIQIDVRKLCK